MTAVPSSNLRHERDRFIAFALAGADILVETDCKLNIHYVTGAVRWLFGQDVGFDGTVNIQGFIHQNHLKLFHAACKLGKKEGRFRTLNLTFQPSGGRPLAVQLSGTYLPNHGGRFFFALRGRAPEIGQRSQEQANLSDTTAKQDATALAETASDVAVAAKENGQNVNLTLFNLSGLDDLQRKLEPDAATELMADVKAQLSVRSLGGSMVTQVSDESFGVIHQPDMNADSLAQDLTECAANFDDDGQGIDVRTSTFDITNAQLTESELAKALVYAIQKFSESQSEFTIGELEQGYKELLKGTGQRFTDLKKLIIDSAFDLAYQPIVELSQGKVHHSCS